MTSQVYKCTGIQKTFSLGSQSVYALKGIDLEIDGGDFLWIRCLWIWKIDTALHFELLDSATSVKLSVMTNRFPYPRRNAM